MAPCRRIQQPTHLWSGEVCFRSSASKRAFSMARSCSRDCMSAFLGRSSTHMKPFTLPSQFGHTCRRASATPASGTGSTLHVLLDPHPAMLAMLAIAAARHCSGVAVADCSLRWMPVGRLSQRSSWPRSGGSGGSASSKARNSQGKGTGPLPILPPVISER